MKGEKDYSSFGNAHHTADDKYSLLKKIASLSQDVFYCTNLDILPEKIKVNFYLKVMHIGPL